MKKIINLIVIVLFTFIITGCSNYHVIGKYLYDPTGYSIGNKVFHSEVNSIFVNWKVGNIYVIQSENHELIIREEADINAEDKYKMHYKLTEDVLDIKFCGSMNELDYKYKTKDLYIFLPSMLDNLFIVNETADITIKNVEINDIVIFNDYGDIMLDKVTGNEFEVENKSGELIILDTKIKEYEILSFTGNVGLSFLELPSELEIKTTQANVVIYISDTQNINIRFYTESGKIESKLDYEQNENEYAFINPTISFVAGCRIETLSGNVKVCRK